MFCITLIRHILKTITEPVATRSRNPRVGRSGVLHRLATIVTAYSWRIAFGPVKTYYVTGLRRSGNHAVIEWIKNGYDEPRTPIVYGTVGSPFLGVSETGKVVHLNGINQKSKTRMARALFECRKHLKGNVDIVIVSTEDCSPDVKRWWLSMADYEIYVTRHLLNVVASRLERLKERALEGRAAKACALYKNFFEHWNQFRLFESEGGRRALRYERWVTEQAYREDMAERIDLPRSVMPNYHSSLGHGSSFVGYEREKNPQAYTERYKAIEWKGSMVKWLMEIDSRCTCLSVPERVFLRSQSLRDSERNMDEEGAG